MSTTAPGSLFDWPRKWRHCVGGRNPGNGTSLASEDNGSPLTFSYQLKEGDTLGDSQTCPDTRCQANPDGGFILRIDRNPQLPPGEQNFGVVRVQDAVGNFDEADLTAVNARILIPILVSMASTKDATCAVRKIDGEENSIVGAIPDTEKCRPR